jgi:TonB family protein
MKTHALLVVVSSLSLSACAASSTMGLGREPSSHATVRFDAMTTATATATFPAVIGEQRLPSADHLRGALVAELGGIASVDVRLCVTPSGEVASVAVERGSTLAAFDEAVARDARAWRFAAQPGPSSLRACERATIEYRAR